jgi:TorA maturation chaperone TorD
MACQQSSAQDQEIKRHAAQGAKKNSSTPRYLWARALHRTHPRSCAVQKDTFRLRVAEEGSKILRQKSRQEKPAYGEAPGLSQAQPTHSDTAAERIAPEEMLRAHLYRLLACFLSGPPAEGVLRAAAALKGDQSALGRAIATFARLAGQAHPLSVKDEYQDLFIGLGRGELVPYGSYYLAGFLQEKPLAKLRQDMERLGLARGAEVRDPEDHIASLCEMMAGLIEGHFGQPLPVAEQRRFFDAHLGSWAGYFFRDLEAAKSSRLYAALGTVGRTFLEIEEGAFALV